MSRLGAALFGLAVAATAACSSDRPLGSCADSLAGVWRADPDPAAAAGEPGPHRYHIVDTGDQLEVYAMFDTTRPPDGFKATNPEIYAPVVFDLDRVTPPGGARITGQRKQRVTRDGVICPIELPAEITGCRGETITLRYEIDRGIDWARCGARQTGRWRSITLHRD